MSGNSVVQVRFRNTESSNDLLELIKGEVDRIRDRYPQVRRCTVSVKRISRRRQNGDPVWARVTVELPGKTLVATKQSDLPSELAAATVAVLQVFNCAEQAVGSFLGRRRVARLSPAPQELLSRAG